MNSNDSICIAGAGSIGCFVGGMLAAAGRDVHMLARPRVVAGIRAHGLRLTSIDGIEQRIAADRLSLSDDPASLRRARIILVVVKSSSTPEIADLIARHAVEDAVVVSLQNGVGNVALLRERLPRVLGGMVPFNVVTKSAGHVHRATSGDLLVENDVAGTAAALSVPGLAVRGTDDIVGVQWGKLLINLNNALNALSDLPLRTQLADRNWRVLSADQMAEGLAVLNAAGIKPVSTTAIPVGVTPWMLRLPNGLFGLLLSRVMKIDHEARSSMWEDLQLRRPTEIDYLQGVIVRMGKKYGVATLLASRIVALIEAAEAAGSGSPGLTPQRITGR